MGSEAGFGKYEKIRAFHDFAYFLWTDIGGHEANWQGRVRRSKHISSFRDIVVIVIS